MERQIDYRPSEQDNLTRDLNCLKLGKVNGFKFVEIDKGRPCFESAECARHAYKMK